MENRANHLLVGTFVLVIVAALVTFVLWFGRSSLSAEGRLYRIYTTGSVTGLSQGSMVRFRGVPIGTVDTIALDPGNVQQVVVTVRIQDPRPLTADSVATVEPQGITGQSFVQITPGGTDHRPLPLPESGEVGVIPSKPGLLAEVFDRVPQIAIQAERAIAGIADLLSPENKQAVAATLKNVELATSRVASALPALESAAIESGTLMTSLNKELPILIRNIDKDRAKVAQRIDQVLAQTGKLADSLSKTSNQLDLAIAELRPSLRAFDKRGIPELLAAIAEIRRLAGDVSRVAEQLERDPPGFLLRGAAQGTALPDR